MTIAIDFDGTCVKHEYPYIGASIGAERVLSRIVSEGHRLILFTMRSDKLLDYAVNWFKKNNIPLYGIQQDPEQSSWTNSPKCYAELYIDDAALGIPLCEFVLERPYVNWIEVEKMLEEKKILTKK